MRDRLLAAGLAAVAFAATLGLSAWRQPASVQTRALLSPAIPVIVPVAASSLADPPPPRPQVEAAVADAAPEPQLPDAAALPSYEEEQAAVNADAMRSARSR